MDSWPSYLIYAIAYAMSVAAFSFNSINVLRILTIISSSCYALYYFIFPTDPLWLDILTESVLVIINVFMLLYLWSKQRQLIFNVEEKEIHHAIFSSLTPFQFFKLIKCATWVTLAENIKLLTRGETVKSIYFIYNGEAQVVLSPDRQVELADGYFIGERSFTLGHISNADVYTSKPSRMVQWKHDDLKELFKRNPDLKRSFSDIISIDMAKKLNL